jgi:predicted porin
MGYEQAKTPAGAKNGGLGMDTASFTLSAVEDLGGGMKAMGSISAGGLARGNSVGGEDASLALSGNFGTLALRTFEAAGSGMTGRASAGAPAYNLHGRVFSPNANIDGVFYTMPKFGDVTVGLNYVDRGDTLPTGLGKGTTGIAVGQPSMGVSVAYAVGAIDAAMDYTSWTRKDDASVAGGDKAKNSVSDRFRIMGNYNLGIAKIGAGFTQTNRTGVLPVTKETLFGFSAPLGAVTVGATFGESKGSATSATEKKSGYTLGMQYDLSKRTNLGVSTFNWKTTGITGNNTGSRILLGHSF